MEGSQDDSLTSVGKTPTIQFSAQNIGTAKVSQRDFFKKHRQEYADRQVQLRKIRHIVIICMLVALLAIVAVTVLVIILCQQSIPISDNQIPPEMQIWNGEAQKIQNTAQEVYEAEQNVGEYFGQQIDEATSDAEKINLVLVEMQFYASNFQPEDVIAAAAKINVDDLTTSQVGIYGGLLMNAYINIGDNAMAEYYLNLMEEKDAIGGGEG